MTNTENTQTQPPVQTPAAPDANVKAAEASIAANKEEEKAEKEAADKKKAEQTQAVPQVQPPVQTTTAATPAPEPPVKTEEPVNEKTVAPVAPDANAIKGGEEIKLTPEQLKELVEDAVNKKIGQIKTAVSINADKGATTLLAQDQVDYNDYLEVPVKFFSYSSYYGVYDDLRGGQSVATPFGRPILFKPYQRYHTKGNGNTFEATTICVCQAVIHSKKEVEFMRTHTRFGIKFWENAEQARNADRTLIERSSDVLARLNNMTQHHVIERAKAYKELGYPIEMSNDVLSLKKQLADVMLKEETKKYTEKQKKKATKSFEDAQYIRGEGA